MSLYEVAKATGISSADLGRYEMEDYHPKPTNLKKLAEYYEVDYRELRTLHYEDEFSDPEEREIIIDWACANDYKAEERALITSFRKHPPNEQKILLMHIEKLLQKKLNES